MLNSLNSSTKRISVELVIQAASSRVFYVGHPWVMVTLSYNCFFDDSQIQQLCFLICTEHFEVQDLLSAERVLQNFSNQFMLTYGHSQAIDVEQISFYNPQDQSESEPGLDQDPYKNDTFVSQGNHPPLLQAKRQGQRSGDSMADKMPEEHKGSNIFGVPYPLSELQSYNHVPIEKSASSWLQSESDGSHKKGFSKQRNRNAKPLSLRIISHDSPFNADGDVTERPSEEITGVQPAGFVNELVLADQSGCSEKQ